ncbi:MAG: adenylate/guanylate cyclase domain-containing protein, partial [Flavobacteriaceae bacterium]|nr:adenylate/guanylate cyclase domain-containing protein [Flavobacteriaceae bacterium]
MLSLYMYKQRQLAAIMFTDIVGYTALMQRDEKEAVIYRQRHRDIFQNATKKYNGKILQYFGDGTLSIFRSSVQAVECAIEMQKIFRGDFIVPVRIGIHVGDIAYSDDDIVGDAVNVASRIESCAVSGSILISDKINDQIRSHQHIQSTYLGAYEFKNVEDPMPLFAISNEGLVVPDREDVRGKLKQQKPKEPSYKLKRKAPILAVFLLILISAVVYFSF